MNKEFQKMSEEVKRKFRRIVSLSQNTEEPAIAKQQILDEITIMEKFIKKNKKPNIPDGTIKVWISSKNSIKRYLSKTASIEQIMSALAFVSEIAYNLFPEPNKSEEQKIKIEINISIKK